MRFCLLLYPDMEPIDLATFGVLSMARRIRPDISISTMASVAGPVRLANGLVVVAEHGLNDPPDFQVLIIGGGPGWTAQSQDPVLLAFLRAAAPGHRLVSVCTGAMILAAAGLLDGKRATSKSEVVPPEMAPLEVLRRDYPKVTAEHASVVDQGMVVTGGGVSLCIDTMLHVLAITLGDSVAGETARILEYSRAWAVNRQALPLISGPAQVA